MRLAWTPEATRSRNAVYDHIEADNPSAALAMDTLFRESAMGLFEHPQMGRPGRIPRTRELVVHPSYVLVYDILGDTIRILRLLHTSRQWPPSG